MPTQLQLEGPELEPLLARVRAEHGASARIVQAEKVRTGGVGGFFARQRFEITVEIDGAAATAAAPDVTAGAPAARPTSILDLADQVSASERTAAAVSTESTGFAAVLARLGATAGQTEPDVLAGARAHAASARPAAPEADAFVVVTPSPQATPAPAARVPAQRTGGSGSPAGPPPRRPAPRAATPARSSRQPAAVARRGSAVVAARPTAGSSAVATRPAPGSAVAVRAAKPAPAPTARSTVAVRAPGTVAVRPPQAAPAPVRPARSTGALAAAANAAPAAPDSVAAQLAVLGLPDHLQPAASGQRLHTALVASLRALPKAPRLVNRAGAVVAVVGPAAVARETAAQIARELDLPRGAVVTGDAVGSPEELRRRRAAWSRRQHTTVVVLDTPLTALAALTARAQLDALEPATTWAVVEATHKPRDLADWSRAVGSVDALAVTAVDETSDPAAVLQLGIPVGRLGRRAATPAAWASLLADRVAA